MGEWEKSIPEAAPRVALGKGLEDDRGAAPTNDDLDPFDTHRLGQSNRLAATGPEHFGVDFVGHVIYISHVSRYGRSSRRPTFRRRANGSESICCPSVRELRRRCSRGRSPARRVGGTSWSTLHRRASRAGPGRGPRSRRVGRVAHASFRRSSPPGRCSGARAWRQAAAFLSGISLLQGTARSRLRRVHASAVAVWRSSPGRSCPPACEERGGVHSVRLRAWLRRPTLFRHVGPWSGRRLSGGRLQSRCGTAWRLGGS